MIGSKNYNVLLNLICDICVCCFKKKKKMGFAFLGKILCKIFTCHYFKEKNSHVIISEKIRHQLVDGNVNEITLYEFRMACI